MRPCTTSRWGTSAEVERVARMAAKRGITNPLGVTRQPGRSTRSISSGKTWWRCPMSIRLHVRDRIDLTAKVAEDGTLNWDVPAGTWKVVRIGRTTTGRSWHLATAW